MHAKTLPVTALYVIAKIIAFVAVTAAKKTGHLIRIRWPYLKYQLQT